MKKPVILSLIILLLITACSPKPESTEVVIDTELREELTQLFSQLKLVEVRSLLSAEMDKGLNDVVLLQNYGLIEYKFFQDYGTAKTALAKAIRLEPGNSSMYESLGEMYFYQGEYNSAIKELTTTLELREDTAELDNGLSKIHFMIGKSYQALGDNAMAIESLKRSIQFNPTRSEASKLLHQLYVEAESYNLAYETWKNENRIVDGVDPYLARTVEYNDLYIQALEGGHRERAEMYNALHLYEEALVEYARVSGDDPEIIAEIKRIETFMEFRNELTLYFEQYYRERCTGAPEFNNYNELVPIYSKISALLGYEEPVNASKSGLQSLNDMIAEEFGFAVDFVMASGVMFGLHFGYIADDISTHVSQWGSTGEFRLIVLKNMVSNGLSDWLTSGISSVGGWNQGDGEMYALLDSGSLISTLSFLDKEMMADWRQQAAPELAESLNRDAAEVFYFPTLVTEFAAQQVNAELVRAGAAGIADEHVETYIINRFQDSLLSSTIVHEGQHALDQYFSTSWYGEHEYRAKLSELAYGDMQYRRLANMHTSDLGSDNDKHSAANTRVYQDIIQHILEHNDQYPEINTAQNIMVQLHELSEGQIKQIAISIFEDNYPEEVYQ